MRQRFREVLWSGGRLSRKPCPPRRSPRQPFAPRPTRLRRLHLIDARFGFHFRLVALCALCAQSPPLGLRPRAARLPRRWLRVKQLGPEILRLTRSRRRGSAAAIRSQPGMRRSDVLDSTDASRCPGRKSPDPFDSVMKAVRVGTRFAKVGNPCSSELFRVLLCSSVASESRRSSD